MDQALKTILTLLLVLPQCSNAQTGKAELVIEAGPNITSLWKSSLVSTENYTVKSNYGSYLGLNLQWNFPNSFGFVTGISMEQRSFVQIIRATSPTIPFSSENRITSTLDYASIPLFARFTYGDNVRFFWNAGLQVSFLREAENVIKTHTHYAGGIQNYDDYFEAKNSEMTNFLPFSIGLCAGAGITIPVKKQWDFFVELRDNFGLTNVFKDNKHVLNGSLSANTCTLNLGVIFRPRLEEE
jgi:hypothetical protein